MIDFNHFIRQTFHPIVKACKDYEKQAVADYHEIISVGFNPKYLPKI